MASITSPGLGSGLDVNSIVSQLIAIESQPLFALDSKEAEFQAQISGIGSLKSALSSLQGAFDGLDDGSVFDNLSASSSDTDVLMALADSTAVPGTFDVTVNRLAQRHKLGSGEFASATTFGGTAGDELTLTVDSESFTIDLSTAKTMSEIRDEIMDTANETGITANIITGDSSKETLVLTAENSGFDDRVQQSFGGTINSSTFGFDTINTDSSGITLSSDAELDASLIVDGVTLTRSDNSISDVVTGVTFNLVAEGDTEVSVQRSDSPITSAVQGIVDGFNMVVNTVKAQSASGSNSSLLRSVEAQLRNALNDRISGLGTFSSLTELGITTTETGTLQLDKTVLSDALSTDRTGVETLFADDDDGFAVKLDNILTGLVQTSGVLDSMVEGLNSQISGLQTHRENLELRLDSTEKRLRAQFTALDGLVARLNTTSNFLSTQLSNLSSILTKNS